MTRLILALSLFCACTTLKSQGFTVQGQFYYGLYSMDDLKDLQLSRLQNANVPLRMTKEIGGFWGYEISGAKLLSNHSSVGVYLGINSTGGRLHYSDYSGQAFVNDKLFGTHTGLSYEFKLNKAENFDVLLGVRAGLSFTNYENSAGIALVGSTQDVQTLNFKSTSIHGGPTILVGKRLDILIVRAFTRYEYNLKTPLKRDDGAMFSNEAAANWGGLRFGLVVGIEF